MSGQRWVGGWAKVGGHKINININKIYPNPKVLRRGKFISFLGGQSHLAQKHWKEMTPVCKVFREMRA